MSQSVQKQESTCKQSPAAMEANDKLRQRQSKQRDQTALRTAGYTDCSTDSLPHRLVRPHF